MSDEKTKADEKTKGKASGAGAGPEPIGVLELRFCVKDGRDINLRGVSINGGKDIVRAGEVPGGVLAIEYRPWMRHHYLRVTDHRGELYGECFVHETWCSWTPLAE